MEYLIGYFVIGIAFGLFWALCNEDQNLWERVVYFLIMLFGWPAVIGFRLVAGMGF